MLIIGDEHKKGVSGGQRKRVNLALELLSDNSCILMLDEPTSGLDPSTELQIHQLLRNFSTRGFLILMISHSLYEATMNVLDMALILTDEGEIAYYGPAMEAKYYFGIETPEEIFNVLARKPSNYWVQKYQRIDNLYYRKYVLTRLNLHEIKINQNTEFNAVQNDDEQSSSPPPRSLRVQSNIATPFQQFVVFSKRLFQRQLRDVQSLASRTTQAILLALVLRIAYKTPESGLLVLISVVPVWLGSMMSIRSINSEISIYKREHRYGTGILPYVLSVFVVNATFALVQIFIFLSILFHLVAFSEFGFNFFQVWWVLYLTALTGVALGMWLSTAFTSQQASINALPVFLVLIILFGGSVIPIKKMGIAAHWTANLIPTRWALEGIIYTGKCMAIDVPTNTTVEWCGQADKEFSEKLHQDGLFALDMKSPEWSHSWMMDLFSDRAVDVKVGAGLRAMGFYRPVECTLDNFQSCPPALIHQQAISVILILFTFIMVLGCTITLFYRTRIRR